MKQTTIGLLAGLLLGVGLIASSAEPTTEARYYDDAKVVRVRTVEGEAAVERSYEEGNEEAVVNLPVFEGDRVSTTEGRLELYLGRGNTLLLDVDSEIELTRAPALQHTDFTVKILRGGVYLDVSNLDNEKDIELQTPDCGVFVLARGIFRVNVLGDGQTEVYVHDGAAEVAGGRTNRTVRDNQKTVMSQGQFRERPFYFYATDRDEFDRWHEELGRGKETSRYASSRYLDRGYEDFEYELTRSGRWNYMSEYGCNVWMPYSVDSDWRPYSNGRWVWHPHYGYTWTSYDPWGWITFHYGRWHWDHSSGWCWVPGYRWSPAWVSWGWDNDYYCWSPLSHWNRPIFIVNNRWDRHYDHRRHGFPHRDRSTIVIRKGELGSANLARVAVRRDGLKSSGPDRAITFRGVAPDSRFGTSKVTLTNARGRAVVYKANAVVSTVRGDPQAGTATLSGGATRVRWGREKTVDNDRGSSRYSGGREQRRNYGEPVVRRQERDSETRSESTWRSDKANRDENKTRVRKDESQSDSTRVRRNDEDDSATDRSDSSSTVKKKEEPTTFAYGSRDSNRSYGGENQSFRSQTRSVGGSRSYRSSGGDSGSAVFSRPSRSGASVSRPSIGGSSSSGGGSARGSSGVSRSSGSSASSSSSSSSGAARRKND